jgi:hypothetical protein
MRFQEDKVGQYQACSSMTAVGVAPISTPVIDRYAVR